MHHSRKNAGAALRTAVETLTARISARLTAAWRGGLRPAPGQGLGPELRWLRTVPRFLWVSLLIFRQVRGLRD